MTEITKEVSFKNLSSNSLGEIEEEDLKKMKRDEIRKRVALIGSEMRKYILKYKEIESMRKQEMIDFIVSFNNMKF